MEFMYTNQYKGNKMSNKTYIYTGELKHWPDNYDYDPTYGMSKEEFFNFGPPPEPEDFADFWQETYRLNSEIPLRYSVKKISLPYDNDYDKYEVYYDSWEHFRTGAVVCIPRNGIVKQGHIAGHGYGGRTNFSVDRAIRDAAFIYPVHRGFDMSKHGEFPENNSSKHVVHNIESREDYIIRGCVAEMWTAVSVLLDFVPEVGETISYSGGSFGGGIGALALAWEKRVKKAKLSVPTFGHHPSRLACKCRGSGNAVSEYYRLRPEIADVLRYYDAAIAAKYIDIPTLVLPAFYDAVVPPPGQFAVCNAIKGPTTYYITSSGHGVFDDNRFEYDNMFAVDEEFFALR